MIVIALVVVIVAEAVAAVIIGGAWFSSPSAADAAREPADPCAGQRSELKILAPQRLAPVLTEAAAHACIDLEMKDPGALAQVGSRMRQGDAALWMADSSEEALAIGVPSDEVIPSFLSPLVVSAPEEMHAEDWRDLLLAAPDGIRLDIPAGAVSEMVFTRVAERALELAGGDHAAVGAALAAVAALVARDENSPTLSIRELASLPSDAPIAAQVPIATLDYPVVRAPQLASDPDAAAASDRLIGALRELTGADLADFGLVPADATDAVVNGTTLPLIPHGAPDVYTAVSAVLDPTLLSGSMTVLMDASGSMATPVGGGASGMDAIKQSVSVLGGTIPSGLYTEWRVFGMGIGDGGADEKLLSAGVVADTRKLIAGSAAALSAFPVGTPLYQVVVDNYRRMKAGPSAGGINLLVVVTDGRDEDAPGRVERAQALAELAQLTGEGPPVPILFMGFGDADLAAMQEIVGVTGGSAWKIDHPSQLSGAIVESVLAIGASEIASNWAGPER